MQFQPQPVCVCCFHPKGEGWSKDVDSRGAEVH